MQPQSGSSPVERATRRPDTRWDLYRGAFSSDSLRAVLDGIIAATAAGDRGAVASFAHANCGR